MRRINIIDHKKTKSRKAPGCDNIGILLPINNKEDNTEQ